MESPRLLIRHLVSLAITYIRNAGKYHFWKCGESHPPLFPLTLVPLPFSHGCHTVTSFHRVKEYGRNRLFLTPPFWVTPCYSLPPPPIRHGGEKKKKGQINSPPSLLFFCALLLALSWKRSFGFQHRKGREEEEEEEGRKVRLGRKRDPEPRETRVVS